MQTYQAFDVTEGTHYKCLTSTWLATQANACSMDGEFCWLMDVGSEADGQKLYQYGVCSAHEM